MWNNIKDKLPLDGQSVLFSDGQTVLSGIYHAQKPQNWNRHYYHDERWEGPVSFCCDMSLEIKYWAELNKKDLNAS